MKSILWIIAFLATPIGSLSAQTFNAGELAELATQVDQKTGGRWTISYSQWDRCLHIDSVGAIEGRDESGGTEKGRVGNYHPSIHLRITFEPNPSRTKRLQDLFKSREDLLDKASDSTLVRAGYAKGPPGKLTTQEWAVYFELEQLSRQIDEFASPTHVFRSLYFVDVSPMSYRFDYEQSPQAKQLKSDQEAVFALLKELKR